MEDLRAYESRMKEKVEASASVRAEIDAIDREIGALEGTAESLESYVDDLCNRVRRAVIRKRARTVSSDAAPAKSSKKALETSPKESGEKAAKA